MEVGGHVPWPVESNARVGDHDRATQKAPAGMTDRQTDRQTNTIRALYDNLRICDVSVAARHGKPCVVLGKTYKDGEEFKPNCSQLCTCQDGRYACASLCPQELRPPSPAHCRDAQLVAIDSRCCREWVCPHTHSLVGPDDSNFRKHTGLHSLEHFVFESCSHWSK